MKVFAKTIFTLLLMASWVFYLSSYYEKIKFQNQIESLNVTMPGSFSYLLDVEKLKKVDLREINRYINFYQKIVDYFPEQADAHSMLGFCYYYRGDGAKALSAYKKAINNHPDYFWFYYNLGVIYFQKSDYVQAVPFLEKAIKTNPDENLRYTLSSNVVYRGVLDEIPQPDQELKRRLVSGYQQAYFLLALS
ncbi:MAG: tetratricopeptide repeat protein, partial [Candidatus Omnitrophota bacterium]|nr:tetratricopeptide repeat protein [Candidatus Omnitrophota bacterium]